MNGRGRRAKGHNGELQFAKLLTTSLKLKKPLTRNIDQVRFGGADIMSLEPFAIEVKRCQTFNFPAWHKQAENQTTLANPVPVLAYRRNNQKWRINMRSKDLLKKRLIKKDEWITITLEQFLKIAKKCK